MDILRLKGLKFRGLHGFYDHEQKNGNDFEVDLEFHISLQQAAVSDELGDTIDYQKIYGVVKSVMEGHSVKLIEHLAKKIGDRLIESSAASDRFVVTLRKLSPPLEGEIEYSEVTLSWPR